MNLDPPIRVLIVDDDTMVLDVIADVMEQLGYTVIGEALDGHEAIAETQRLSPDLVLMDIKMPGLDGIAAARQIQELCPTPVVILTAHDDRELIAKARDAGVAAYLVKPPSVAEVARVIPIALARFNDFMALRRLNAQLEAEIVERQRVEVALRESEEKFRSIVEYSGDAIVLVDQSGHVIAWNSSAERIFGLKQTEVLNRPLWDVQIQVALEKQQTPAAYQRLKGVLQSFFENHNAPWASQLQENAIQRPDGTQRVIQSLIFPIETAQGFMAGSIIRDITESKQAEHALKRYALELESSNENLRQFTHTISHDLKEPLRMVTSYLKLLQRRYQDQLDAKANEFIWYAVDGAERMNTLIMDLLEYSRVSTRGQALVPTDCEGVLENVLRGLQFRIGENNAVVTHDPLPTVMGDVAQLERVFQNLIVNALKFQSPSEQEHIPRVHISAERVPISDASIYPGELAYAWRFAIQDNGIGIASKDFARIFGVFQRLHSSEEYEGTGIGLAICKKIIERHGGEIWVESQPGEGATFYFTLSPA